MTTLVWAQLKKMILAVVLAFLFSDTAFAAERTVTLSAPGMHCAVCPITVRNALKKVPGVSKVNVSLEKKEAVVTFDDTRTNIQTLEHATLEAGYASTIETPNKQGVTQ
ncbi:MAG: mercury resistance system periplasmic binding protein MerP [Betaproteobacteria bacterium]|nr:mercury resistance system periplasmic binding protein MerP [Betaproteobacteria bacterium]